MRGDGSDRASFGAEGGATELENDTGDDSVDVSVVLSSGYPTMTIHLSLIAVSIAHCVLVPDFVGSRKGVMDSTVGKLYP